ncbi:hypothetical protein I203_104811 [Kwoniella mangroviensis CBS 8507]|uniref:uncharacterized protein n=1 Tax=Kwoniella mangroviensis CBS 8507 TaxID=1296122 RepID=UPI00080CCF0A|nr:uncharacterized protein I203_00247 [Kwoniella mangroviensis CBS 8507]OCF70115.1 hypothetical protein I203_00247 [Kwoniella mangroviensis CBS 8507]
MIRPPRSIDTSRSSNPDVVSSPPSPLITPRSDIPRASSSQQSDRHDVRRTRSSYFAIPSTSVIQQGGSISPYRPRENTTLGSTAGTSNTSRYGSHLRPSSIYGLNLADGPSNNWSTLQELVGDDDFEEDELSGSPRISSQPSTRSLRSLFIPPTPREHRTHPVDVRQRIEDLPTIADQLVGSPPQLNGEPPNNLFVEHENQIEVENRPTFSRLPSSLRTGYDATDDTHERNGVKSPLVRERTTPIPEAHESTKSPWRVQTIWKRVWRPSPVSIAIFKCSLAYLVASLFTYVPFLAELLSTQTETDAHGRVTYRPANSAHMVATIVVYYNPAKSLGNMLLSTRYCFLLALFASFVSISAIGTIELFDHFSPSHGSSWDWISEIGDWIVCILWIGGSMSTLAWSKLWVGNASYNTGCSMAAIIIYSVVIKEGAFPKLMEVLYIVAVGVIISSVICFTIFPSSATTKFQDSMSRSLNSFSTLLDLLTSTFLLEKQVIRGNRSSLKHAIKSHSAGFKALKVTLAEAKHERILDSRIRGRNLHLYDAAIASLARLAQHLSSLRGSTRLQESLIRAVKEGSISTEHFVPGFKEHKLSMSIVNKMDDRPGPEMNDNTDIEKSIRLFMKFRLMAGDQMNDLNNRCDEALEAVQLLSQHDLYKSPVDLAEIRENLAKSLKDFSSSSSRAIKRVYAGPKRRRGIYESDSESSEDDDPDSSSTSENEEDKEKNEDLNKGNIIGGPNETVFLVYFFLFTFEEFAREMLFLLETMQEIVDVEPISTWGHLKSVIIRKRGKKEKRTQYLYKQLHNLVPIDPSKLQPPPFPKNRNDSAGTVLIPDKRSLNAWGRFKQAFWRFGERLREPDMRYAIKTGLGGAILAAPAYTEAGRPFFLQYRGEWALIAYLAAMSQTVGQTNFLSLARVGGTIIGGTVAIIFTKIAQGNNVLLPILGFFFAIPCFYVITQMPDYTNAGRFVLLTYNLSCLYTYNVGERYNLTVEQIAVQRSAAVIIGVLWAAAVSRWWWPFTARRELRLGLSDFCLDLSYLYSRLVMTYSKGANNIELDGDQQNMEEEDGETTPLMGNEIHFPHLSASVRQFMAMELHLQSQILNLRSLLAQTKNEPRLKGPFAFTSYNEVLLSCERMLDKLHSMRCVTTRDEWDHAMRKEFVVPVNGERREMAGHVILYFYTLSAGFRTRTPLPPYLPPAEESRQKLIRAIRSLDVVRRRSVRGGGRHLLFFAYATAMQEVIAELEYLGEMMQEAYGVISQSTKEDFEDLFELTIEHENEDDSLRREVEENEDTIRVGSEDETQDSKGKKTST